MDAIQRMTHVKMFFKFYSTFMKTTRGAGVGLHGHRKSMLNRSFKLLQSDNVGLTRQQILTPAILLKREHSPIRRNTKSLLGYWAIRGLGQPIRLLLTYVGEDFLDIHYFQGDGPEFSKSEWDNVKYTIGFDFPNLPYYIDGQVKLTQSNTILRYLARKHKLYGTTDKEHAEIDLLLDVIMDVRNGFVGMCYGTALNDQIRNQYKLQVTPILDSLDRYLGSKTFFTGDKVKVCDFHIYEMLDVHRIFEPKLLEERPKLNAYVESFAALPAISKYLASNKTIVRPINNKCAHFL